jgi:L-arabinose 1-dehydrogenase [NAD(P)+]
MSHDGVEAVNLRIGWYMSKNELREQTGDGVDLGKDQFAWATWLSPRECRAVH